MSRKWMIVMVLAVSGAAPMAALAEGPVGTSGGPEITNGRAAAAARSHDVFSGARNASLRVSSRLET
jgi:hypothetical protein